MLDKELKHVLLYTKLGDEEYTSSYLHHIKPTNS